MKVENRCLDEHFFPFSVPKKRSGVTVVEWCPNEKAFLIYVYTVDKAYRERPSERVHVNNSGVFVLFSLVFFCRLSRYYLGVVVIFSFTNHPG